MRASVTATRRGKKNHYSKIGGSNPSPATMKKTYKSCPECNSTSLIIIRGYKKVIEQKKGKIIDIINIKADTYPHLLCLHCNSGYDDNGNKLDMIEEWTSIQHQIEAKKECCHAVKKNYKLCPKCKSHSKHFMKIYGYKLAFQQENHKIISQINLPAISYPHFLCLKCFHGYDNLGKEINIAKEWKSIKNQSEIKKLVKILKNQEEEKNAAVKNFHRKNY